MDKKPKSKFYCHKCGKNSGVIYRDKKKHLSLCERCSPYLQKKD